LTQPNCRTAILISGSGTNLQSFIDKQQRREIELQLCVVFSNKPDAYGLERARTAGIPTECLEHGKFADRESFDRAMSDVIDGYDPELIVLAGFMRILSPWFVNRYEGRILNIHPALLPAYPGLDTHQRVLESGDKHHGSTVHFVTDELDGGPCVLQGRLEVKPGESPDELRKRVQAIEHIIYPEAAKWFGLGRLAYRDGEAWLDGAKLDSPVVWDLTP
jgi:phosphoribosylglycinamide formyltransferase-1